MLRRLLWGLLAGSAFSCSSTGAHPPTASPSPQDTTGAARTVCELVTPTMHAAVSEFMQQLSAPRSNADTGLGNSRNALHGLVDDLPPTDPIRVAVNRLADGFDAGVQTLTRGQHVNLEPILEAEHQVLDACAPYTHGPSAAPETNAAKPA